MSGDFEKYGNESGQKWGKTKEYAEYLEKSQSYSPQQFSNINSGLEDIFADFAQLLKKGSQADSSEAQALVKKLQNYISENYFSCSNEVLSGLGKMYVGDDRFKKNIDKNHTGTAEFVCSAIKIYCGI